MNSARLDLHKLCLSGSSGWDEGLRLTSIRLSSYHPRQLNSSSKQTKKMRERDGKLEKIGFKFAP